MLNVTVICGKHRHFVAFDRRSGLVEVTNGSTRRREGFALVRSGQFVAVEPEDRVAADDIRHIVAHAMDALRYAS